MQYIVFDLEFNQDAPSLRIFDRPKKLCSFEIIQIGALKLDEKFHTIETFNRYIKPTFYGQISPFVAELTGITTKQLESEALFPEVYRDFIDFIGSTDTLFCVWGLIDMKELFKNALSHELDINLLPKHYINIQPYTSLHFHLPIKKLLSLELAVSMLHIPMTHPFHNALHDAYYTAEIFKKVYRPSHMPSIQYDPFYKPVRPSQPKKKINFEKLIQQFEKMYERAMTPEEVAMIKLAYQMGKTHQFLE